jgi:hypothetical protein
MTDAELDEALSETDERKSAAQEALDRVLENEDWLARLEALRDLILWGYGRGAEVNYGHTPHQKARIYRKMRLRVTLDAEGEGMRLEFAYAGEEGFCDLNNPS